MNPTMRLPGFLIIGAMKAGTTSLFHALRAHPNVFFGTDKEPNDLIDPRVTSPEGRRRYADKYAGAKTDDVCGDASTNYSKLPDIPGVPERARAVLGEDVRVIYLVREPVARARSHHFHLLVRGEAPRSFEETLELVPGVRDYGCYGAQLESWAATFPIEQLKVIRLEDYVQTPQPVLAEVFEFLDLKPFEIPPHIQANVTATTPPATGVWAAIRDNRFYRQWVRPALSLENRERVRSLLIRAPRVAPDPPRPETVAQLGETFAADAAKLSRLLGPAAPRWD